MFIIISIIPIIICVKVIKVLQDTFNAVELIKNRTPYIKQGIR